MRWIIRLAVPRRRRAGSLHRQRLHWLRGGFERVEFVGIEREEPYAEIAAQRILADRNRRCYQDVAL